jgi:hypothetical protein
MYRRLASAFMSSIPEDLRARTYASLELILDVLHAARTYVDIDLESLMIYLCVAEATMRPVLSDPEYVKQIATTEVAPEDVRGSITMLLVADKLDMPRETVRRKVKKLIQSGLLYEDAKSRVRSTPNFNDPRVNQSVHAIQDAVDRYVQRLSIYGVKT